jgi:2-polyprenyl-3-methyl-5-hydroxy-6-metoxy-1,4-benzoquinol methylase
MTMETKSLPGIEEQRACWDGWNNEFRSGGECDYQQRQATIAANVARRLASKGSIRILDVGCGTGWLCNRLLPFGEVSGTDLSIESCRRGEERYQSVKFYPGDFTSVELPNKYHLITSADVIAHVPDQQLFVDRVASLLVPGGTFLLMTQNSFVWNRSSYLRAQRPGQIRNWPTISRLRMLFSYKLSIEHITSIFPGGDRGVLRLTGNRISRALLRRSSMLTTIAEKCMLGRDIIIEARAPIP